MIYALSHYLTRAAVGSSFVLFLLFAAQPVCGDEAVASSDRETELIAVLQSDAPPQDKAITCKHLAVYGTAKAVPALAPLLTNPELTSWARIPLEVIEDPAAGAALRNSLDQAEGRVLVGIINSLGVRRDVESVPALIQRLQASDADVAAAAAVALGRIGASEAGQALQDALADLPAAARSPVAEGCILCAEHFLANGQADQAIALYDQVRMADVSPQRTREAIRGSILARQLAGIPILVEQLQSDDQGRFTIGLQTANELAGAEVTQAIVGLLNDAKPDRQALLVEALANRSDDAALPAILQAVEKGSRDVQLAAIGVMPRVGNASCVSVLLAKAAGSDSDVSQAATAALEKLAGVEVNKDLAARLPQAKGKVRQTLIELIGLRRIDAVPALIAAADDTDAAIRQAALTALGETVGPGDLKVLITRAVKATDATDAEVARKALLAASSRMPDREACATELVAAMPGAPVPAQNALLETLGAVGGTTALTTLGQAAKGKNPVLQDTASRLLGGWMTADAAPVLYGIAQDVSDDKYQTRAVRGYMRIARQFVKSDEERLEMCRQALKVSRRDAERTLVLETLERMPSIEALELAVEISKVATMKKLAANMGLQIAQGIEGNGPRVEELLKQLGHDTVDITIVKAEYGAGTQVVDVTEIVKKHARGFAVIKLPSDSYNACFGGDPAPGTAKQLKISYKINGQAGDVVLKENAPVVLPMP